MVSFLPIFAAQRLHRSDNGTTVEREKSSCLMGMSGLSGPRSRVGALIIALVLCLLAVASPSSGAIYKYEDENGVVHFTNCPRDGKFKLYIREAEDRNGSNGPNYVSYRLIRDSKRYDPLIHEYSQKYEVDFALIKAIMRAESGFNPTAVSRKGARGLMQLMPETAQRMNVSNSFSPRDNIEGGVRYLKYLLQLFNDDLRLSLAAYNAGENIVSELGSIPPYRETVDYVHRVLNYYHYYRQ
jgi:hypothetical protein